MDSCFYSTAGEPERSSSNAADRPLPPSSLLASCLCVWWLDGAAPPPPLPRGSWSHQGVGSQVPPGATSPPPSLRQCLVSESGVLSEAALPGDSTPPLPRALQFTFFELHHLLPDLLALHMSVCVSVSVPEEGGPCNTAYEPPQGLATCELGVWAWPLGCSGGYTLMQVPLTWPLPSLLRARPLGW